MAGLPGSKATRLFYFKYLDKIIVMLCQQTPFALSLSKGSLAWFDRLTTNGVYDYS
jgi:hypothetical protein